MLSVYEEIHLTTLYIYLLDRFFFLYLFTQESIKGQGNESECERGTAVRYLTV